MLLAELLDFFQSVICTSKEKTALEAKGTAASQGECVTLIYARGGLFAALLLTHFMGTSVTLSPLIHLVEFVLVLLVLVVLSVVTWHWLGGKETK